MKKRLITVLFVLSLTCLGIFTACGQTAQGPSSTGGTQTSDSTEASDSTDTGDSSEGSAGYGGLIDGGFYEKN